MKKIILSVSAIIAIAFNGSSQVASDLNFENWSVIFAPSGPMEDPNGWASFNLLNSAFTGSMPLTVFKETTGVIPAGLIAAKIVTEVVPGTILIPDPFQPGQNFDTVGLVATGKIIVGSPPSLKLGNILPAGVTRPATLSFSSKYTPVSGDSAFVLAYITRWNGASRDTIAEGQYATNATTTSFALNNITMVYDPAFSSAVGDTMIILASSSVFRHSGAKKGSTFYVDNFVWSGYNSINEIGNIGSVSIFPNPAVNHVTFTSTVNAVEVEVMDLAGRKVGVFSMNGNTVTVETTSFSSGMYLFNVLNEKKQVINRGKFEIAK